MLRLQYLFLFLLRDLFALVLHNPLTKDGHVVGLLVFGSENIGEGRRIQISIRKFIDVVLLRIQSCLVLIKQVRGRESLFPSCVIASLRFGLLPIDQGKISPLLYSRLGTFIELIAVTPSIA